MNLQALERSAAPQSDMMESFSKEQVKAHGDIELDPNMCVPWPIALRSRNPGSTDALACHVVRAADENPGGLAAIDHPAFLRVGGWQIATYRRAREGKLRR